MDPILSLLVSIGTAVLYKFGDASIEIGTGKIWEKVNHALNLIRSKHQLQADKLLSGTEPSDDIIDCTYEDKEVQQSLKLIGEEVQSSTENQFIVDHYILIESLQRKFLSKSKTQQKSTSLGDINAPSQCPIVVGDGASLSVKYENNNYTGSPQDI